MSTDLFQAALEKGAGCERIAAEEALALVQDLTPDRLHALGRAALSNRRRRFGDQATYVFNIQINPSNICAMRCTFCNYSADRGDDHAYVLEEGQIFAQIDALKPVEAHIVGGLNTVWPYARNLKLVQQLRRRYPSLHIKAFTAVEIAYFADTSGASVQAVLEELAAAGMDAMPGGGAEIFSEDLHLRHWPNKIGPDRWLEIHSLAHSLGIVTNATMLYGFGETWRQRIDHLMALRRAQDRSPGFECFIPLAFQPGPGTVDTEGPPPLEILAVMAVSRLVLDNIAHVKSYWPMIGLETAAAGLSWGGDDMDGTIQTERIAHLAGAKTPKGLAREQMTETIICGGFTPLERDGRFRPVSTRESNLMREA